MMDSAHTLTTATLALGELLQRLYTEILEQQNLSRMHFALLYVLSKREGMKMVDLTALLDMTKGNVTYHVDHLEATGWMCRAPSETDRRVTLLCLTPAGRDVLKRVNDEFEARFARLAAEAPATEVIMMKAGLSLLLARGESLFRTEESP